MKKIQYMEILILRFSYPTYRFDICQDRRDRCDQQSQKIFTGGVISSENNMTLYVLPE